MVSLEVGFGAFAVDGLDSALCDFSMMNQQYAVFFIDFIPTTIAFECILVYKALLH